MTEPRYHPFARLCLCALGLVVASIVMVIMLYVGSAFASVWTARPPGQQLEEVTNRFALPLMLASYPAQIIWISYCRTHLDRFSFASMGFRRSRFLPNLLRGALTGLLSISLLFGVLWLSGLISVTGWSTDVTEGGSNAAALALAGYAITFFCVAFFEELLFRGYALHNFNSWLGWKGALCAQGALFALVHMMNVAGAPVEAQAAAIGAMPSIMLIGVFFGLCYRKTGSLWFPIGFHFAWNFFLGNVFSLPVSGIPTFRLLEVSVNQSNWLTGGSFGAEGSVLLIPILVALIYFISLAPDHPQAVLDLDLLNQEEAPLPAPVTTPTEVEEEENRENRFRTKFGTSQGFSAETLRELRDLQEERERVARETKEEQRRAELATSSFAPSPAPQPIIEIPTVPMPVAEKAPVTLAPPVSPAAPVPPAPVPTPIVVPQPPAPVAPAPPKTPPTPVAPPPVAPPAPAPPFKPETPAPSSDAPVKKKPPSPRW